jgi:hypothetical protein
VPFIRYETKAAAGRAEETFLAGSACFGILAGALSLIPGGQAGAGISGVISSALALLGGDAHRAVADPPRPDFETRTGWRRRQLPTDVLTDSEVELATARFAESARYSGAFLSAFVRAVERSQRAQQLGDRLSVERKVDEATLYARRASETLRSLAELHQPLISQLSDDRSLNRLAQESVRQSTPEEMKGGAFYQVAHDLGGEQGGRLDEDADSFSIDPEFQDDPLEACIRVLRRAATASEELARSLAWWGPTDEEPRLLG